MNCKPIFGEILPPGEEKFAFVLMPFEKSLEKIYYLLKITPAASLNKDSPSIFRFGSKELEIS